MQESSGRSRRFAEQGHKIFATSQLAPPAVAQDARRKERHTRDALRVAGGPVHRLEGFRGGAAGNERLHVACLSYVSAATFVTVGRLNKTEPGRR